MSDKPDPDIQVHAFEIDDDDMMFSLSLSPRIVVLGVLLGTILAVAVCRIVAP